MASWRRIVLGSLIVNRTLHWCDKAEEDELWVIQERYDIQPHNPYKTVIRKKPYESDERIAEKIRDIVDSVGDDATTKVFYWRNAFRYYTFQKEDNCVILSDLQVSSADRSS